MGFPPTPTRIPPPQDCWPPRINSLNPTPPHPSPPLPGRIDLHAEQPGAKDRPWSDAAYSLGARQTLYRMFNRTPGFHILDHHTHADYWQRLARSTFCLAAAGWGWGGRMKVAVTRGECCMRAAHVLLSTLLPTLLSLPWLALLPCRLHPCHRARRG